MSPTARTMEFFREQGCEVVKIEHFHKWARRTIDTWGADLLVRQGSMGMAIQATDATHHAHRTQKAIDNPLVLNWLKIGIRYYIYSWGLKGKRGERKTYQPRITQLVLNGDEKVVVL